MVRISKTETTNLDTTFYNGIGNGDFLALSNTYTHK